MGSRLSNSAIALYALPVTGQAAMFWLVMLYLLKYSTDVLGVAPAAIGALFGLTRIWDALSDPLAGYWSDRTRSALGRRRPWMLASALPLGLAFYALWSPAAALPQSALVPWMGAALLVFYTAQTLFAVPHASLGAELTDEYHDRTRLFAARGGFEVLGMFLGIAALFWLENSATPRESSRWIAALVGGLATALILHTSARIRERPEFQGRVRSRPLRAFGDVWRNPHARILMLVFFLNELGFGALLVTLPFASEHILGTPGYTALYMLCFLIPMAISIPFWVPISRKLGKTRSWILSNALSSLGLAGLFFIGEGDWAAIVALAALIGLANGASRCVPPSMQADVIDYDELRTGERKEGSYFAAWNFVLKSAGGLSILLAGLVLQLSGFAPNAAGGAPDPQGIRIVLSILPACLLALSALLLLRFRLGEREHMAIRAALNRPVKQSGTLMDRFIPAAPD